MIMKKHFKIFSNNEQLNDAIQDNEISNYLQDFVNKSLEVKYEKEEFKILQKINQKQHTEINRLNKVIQNIREEFLRYNWKESTNEQIYNQLKNLYESIFMKEE